MLTALLQLALLAPQTAVARPADLEERLRRPLAAFLAVGRVPGVSAGVVLADGTAFALAAGFADREEKRALRPDDLLCGGSSGKTFVAAVALQLVEEGKLHLDDLVGEYLGDEPWFERLPNASSLTLAHLLGHRSGLPRHEFEPAFVQAVLADPDRVWKPAELVAYVLDRPPPFAAGAGFAYSDTNFILVGMIVERVTQHRLEDEIQRRLLGPLHLEGGIEPQTSRTIARLVQGYVGKNDPFGAPELTLTDGRFFLNPQFEWAGGGYVDNGGALARWAKALHEGPVLKAASHELMVAGADASRELGPGTKYGLGCEVWSTAHGVAYGHAGFFPGYLTEMRYWPEHRIAVAVQVNTSEHAALPESLGELCEQLLVVALAKDKG